MGEPTQDIPWKGMCGSCKFFVPCPCRRHAPRLAGDFDGTPHHRPVTRWPDVTYFEWCGDYEEKPRPSQSGQ